MDNQNQQGERRKGVVDYINDSRRTLASIKRASSSLRTVNVALKTVSQVVTKPFPWVWIVVIIILLIVIFQLFFGGGTGFSFDLDDSDSNLPGGPGSGNISSCQYTRAGEQHLIKSSTLVRWINEAAISAGIPPSVLASVAMHESQNFLTTYDNNSPEIMNDYFCGAETPTCTDIATNTTRHDGECIPGETGVVTDLHRGLLQISSYFNPTINACSITDSLTWAANKLKADGVTAQPTQTQINNAVDRYYGSCDYGSYNYCDEVWQDHQNCRTAIIADASSCPIPNGVVNCGSKNRPINGPLGLCGHCGVGYGVTETARNCGYPGTQYAMDIGGADLSPIYLPKIGGNVIRWIFAGEGQGSQAIQRYTGLDELTHEQYFISFHHTQSGSGNPGTHFSGEVGARICGNGCNQGHVHVEFGTGSQGSYLDAPDYFCRR